MYRTLLLVQWDPNPQTMVYSAYESVEKCMVGVCMIYEEHLKRAHPYKPTITYDISMLFQFIDQLADLTCLVYQNLTGTYVPFKKYWIKQHIYLLMHRATNPSAQL